MTTYKIAFFALILAAIPIIGLITGGNILSFFDFDWAAFLDFLNLMAVSISGFLDLFDLIFLDDVMFWFFYCICLFGFARVNIRIIRSIIHLFQ